MICSKCSQEMKLVPAGTSKKTGKPYDAFYGCTRECGHTEKLGAPKAPQKLPLPNPPNWEAISFGKCRTKFLVEAFKKGMAMDTATQEACNRWAFCSMKGYFPQDTGDFEADKLQPY